MLTTHRQTSAEEFLPTRRSLKSLREAARSCEGCDLYRNATQTVFGEGPKEARVALVGEQPGDMEDRQGRPFVGPAGRILDKALAEADMRREDVYVTNAVKTFQMDSARQATHASTTGATVGDSVQAMATRRISSRSASTVSVPGRHRCSRDVGESDRDC
jgi:ribosomal protein S17